MPSRDKVEGFSSKRTYLTILTLLVILGSAIRVFVCLQHNPLDYLSSDMLRHWENGLWFPRGGYTAVSDPILYQIYVFVLQRLTNYNKLLIGIASGLLSALMPWTYYRAARESGLRKAAALWVWILIVWTPSLFTIYHYIMMETLLLLVDGIALWMSARYLRKGGTQAFLLSIFFWTLACLTKPTVIPLAGVCVLWSCWKRLPPVRALVAATVMVVILLLPQGLRSRMRLGFFAPFGNPWLTKIQHRSGAKTIYVDLHVAGGQYLHLPSFSEGEVHMVFASPSCYIQPLYPLSHWHLRRAANNSKIRVTVNTAHGAEDWKSAYRSLNVDRHEWLAQWGENIVLFFFAPSWPESGQDEWDGKLVVVTRWMWAPVIVFVLLGNGRAFLRRRFEFIPVVVTLFTLFLMLQNVATTEGRYRQPLEPLLLLNLVWVINQRDTAAESTEKTADVSASLIST